MSKTSPKECVTIRRGCIVRQTEPLTVELLAEAIKKALEEETPESVTAIPDVAWMDSAGKMEEDIEHLRNLFNANGLMKFTIDRVECAAGSSSGDNYMSVVKRVHIFAHKNKQLKPTMEDTGAEGATEAYTVIIKRLVPSVSRRQLYRCIDAYINEIHSYRFVVPLLNMHSKHELCPKCYLALKNDLSYHGDPIIVMEDLRRSGFRMQNRLVGLELKQCTLVMQKLAQWHAAGLAAKLLMPTVYRRHTESMREIVYTGDASAFYTTILGTSLQQAIDSLTKSNVDGSLTEPLRLIKRQRCRLYRHIQESILDGAESELSVVCHGDLWVNNIMFTEPDEQEEPMQVIFFDLQAVRVSSAIFDILHFFYTSTRRQLRDAHVKMLISTYSDTLLSCLEEQLTDDHVAADLAKLRESFQFERVYKEYEKFIMYGLAIAMWILPAVTFDPDNIPDLDEISEHNTSPKQIKVQKNLTPTYHERIKELALEFYEKGYLQANDAADDNDDENEVYGADDVDTNIWDESDNNALMANIEQSIS